MRTAVLILLPVAATVAGCTPNDIALGGAVRNNALVQTIDPDPIDKGGAGLAASGDRTALAQERYRKGRVTPVETSTTTMIQGVSAAGATAGPR